MDLREELMGMEKLINGDDILAAQLRFGVPGKPASLGNIKRYLKGTGTNWEFARELRDFFRECVKVHDTAKELREQIVVK